jgi:hypothetical protein
MTNLGIYGAAVTSGSMTSMRSQKRGRMQKCTFGRVGCDVIYVKAGINGAARRAAGQARPRMFATETSSSTSGQWMA